MRACSKSVRNLLYDFVCLMLDGTLFQARGPLYLKDCLVIFNLQNEG